nr:ribosomal RNA small subunit methyltransferase A [Cryptomonas sp.]
MKRLIDELSKLNGVEPYKIILVNVSSYSQISLFSQIKRTIIKYILNSRFKNTLGKFPVFDIFISLNIRSNNEKFILKIILRKPICEKAFFLCNNETSNRIYNMLENKPQNRYIVYLKISSRITNCYRILPNDVISCGNKIIKFVPRKILPKINFFKLDPIIKIFFCKKKNNMGVILKSKNFLKNIKFLLSKPSNHNTIIKDYLQRIFEEIGLLSSKIHFSKVKDFLLLYNNL